MEKILAEIEQLHQDEINRLNREIAQLKSSSHFSPEAVFVVEGVMEAFISAMLFFIEELKLHLPPDIREQVGRLLEEKLRREE